MRKLITTAALGVLMLFGASLGYGQTLFRSFELSGLLGERILRVTGLDPTWQIERITHGRTPVRTLTIPPGEALHDITVVLSQR